MATTTSLAMKPVTSDPAASQVPKPAGANTGAAAALTCPKALSRWSSTPQGRFIRNHRPTEMMKMTVPALTTNSLVFCQVWVVRALTVGTRYGGSSSAKTASSRSLRMVRERITATRPAMRMPTR